MNENTRTGDAINWDQIYNYPLQWLYESLPARLQYQQWLYRINLAMLGKPWRNLYQEELHSAAQALDDPLERQRVEDECVQLPEGWSFTLAEAVQTCANQLASGVDIYEYQINDPYGIIEDDTEANLAACCSQDYTKNKLGLSAALYTQDLIRYGMCAVLVSYDKETQENVVTRIHPKNCWVDTMYSATGNERFRGYSTMIDWRTLKQMVEADPDNEINLGLEVPTDPLFDEKGNLMPPTDQTATLHRDHITTLNDLDIYVENLNKLATAPGLQGFTGQYYGDYDHDLRNCYNLNWYHSFATSPEARTNSHYGGMDVELTVIYDLKQHVEFKIINRRYVIARNKAAFEREIVFPIYNPYNDTITQRIDTFHMNCPLVFQFEDQDTRDKFAYPSSKLFSLLDLHDELCSWRAKRAHVSRILAILRISTNGADARVLKRTMNIMGATFDSLQTDPKALVLDYSWEAIDTQIAILEQTIKERLNAYNQFDAMQVMGDRASAAESGMAIGAVAQGLATLQNALMELYADIARQMIANRVVYSPTWEFPIVNDGNYSSITIQQMALDAIITVKSKMAKKVQERMLATNALALLPTVQSMFNEQGISYLIEMATLGNMPRKMAQTFINPPAPDPNEVALAQQQAANDATALQQNQMMYEQNPLGYEAEAAMQGASPDEIDQMIAGVSQSPDGEEISFEETLGGVNPLNMEQQDGAMVAGLQGMTNETGSQLANPNALVG